MFLTSWDETQTMVQAKLRPKLRPRQTLYLPGKGETQTIWSKLLGRENSDHGLNFGLPRGGVDPVLMNDAYNDCIARLSHAFCFMGYCASIARSVAEWGIA